MSTGHPKRIDDITAEWLTRAMRESGVCRESHVAAMDMTSIGGGGVGFLSGLARIKLTYDQPEPQAPARSGATPGRAWDSRFRTVFCRPAGSAGALKPPHPRRS